jgi:PTH2 family peptidyl-tRNA hydrolase
MRKGKMVAQGGHAVMATFTQYLSKESDGVYIFTPPKAMEEWLFDQSFIKICVSVNSEDELKEVCQMAVNLDVPFSLIQDKGHTEFHGVPTYTGAAIGPEKAEIIDRITGHLPLL